MRRKISKTDEPLATDDIVWEKRTVYFKEEEDDEDIELPEGGEIVDWW